MIAQYKKKKFMKLGFIGTGKISSSVITGICNSNISYKKIIVSSRNLKIAKHLKKKFKKIFYSKKDNQEIINSCDWIFLAVTPSVGEKIIKHLKFRSNQTIISFISTITLSELKKMIKVKSRYCKSYSFTTDIFKERTSTNLPSK